jgi:hypothetical protein
MPEIISRAAAKARGLKFYFTGKPCKHGHVAERRVAAGGICVVCSSEKTRRWSAKHPEYYRTHARQRRQKPGVRAQHAAYVLKRCQSDPQFKLSRSLRRRVREALKFGWKSAPTMELVGCDMECLRDWLECQFQPGMDWDNYGPVWHLDHIRPCASFNLDDPAQQRECFNFTNFQPLFGPENISKGARPETDDEMVARGERIWIAR